MTIWKRGKPTARWRAVRRWGCWVAVHKRKVSEAPGVMYACRQSHSGGDDAA